MGFKRNRMSLLLSRIFILSSALSITACDLDFNDGDTSSAPPPQPSDQSVTGIFWNGPVTGLEYETDSQGRQVIVDGEFSYMAGETVRFYLGGTELGSAAAKSMLSPLDLVSEANGDPSHAKVLNILRLLQTADNNGDSKDGIVISSDVRSAMNAVSIDLNTLSSSTLEPLFNANPLGSPVLVAPELALNHFYTVMAEQGIELADPDAELNLHVASPDWRDQVIYFMMIDRFNDGDPSNNDMGVGEYQAIFKEHTYSGGDIQGIIDRLDYIKGMGATSIWITPPVANQWWDGGITAEGVGGYHGYWARHFKLVDEHYGTLDTYKQLSHTLHQNGMYLIQDVVVNHTGNFTTFGPLAGWDSENPQATFAYSANTAPGNAPTQWPFYLNDPTNPAHFDADIYHWTPVIGDFSRANEVENYQLSELDDLNTDNPVVRNALKDSFNYWLKEVGVDGYRLDTAKFVSHDFWNDWHHATDPDNPGILPTARMLGKDNFLTFGEVFDGSDPFSDAGEKKLVSYLGSEEAPELVSVINFPMYFEIGRVFGSGQPTAQMAFRLEQHMNHFDNPYIVPTFLDNHDVGRFISKASGDALKQAVAFMMTIPGIPVIYQGTEQAVRESRYAMFEGGWNPALDVDGDGAADSDLFDTSSDMYQFTQAATTLRTSNRIFTRGTLEVLASNQASAGLLAYKRSYEGQNAYVLFNTSNDDILVSNFATEEAAGSVLKLAMGHNASGDVVVGQGGSFTLPLAARGIMVLLSSDETESLPDQQASLSITTALNGQEFAESVVVSGTASSEISEVQLVVDGSLGQAVSATPDSEGNWSAAIPVDIFDVGLTEHSVVAYAPALGLVTDTQTMITNLQFGDTPTLTLSDPADDDKGPMGTYLYPSEQSYHDGQMDLLGVDVYTQGGNVKLTFHLPEVSTQWGPANGFDHLSLSVFFDVPWLDNGIAALPEANANAPAGFNWNYGGFVFGWGNGFFNSVGADADNWGEVVLPAPDIEVDQEGLTVSLIYKSSGFGRVNNLSGVKVYVSTWDRDGLSESYRLLAPEVGEHSLGGGDGSVDPLIMDDIDVITIP